MNTTNVLVTTNGAIITVTRLHHVRGHFGLAMLAVAGIVCVSLGIWLLLRSPKS